MLYSLIFPGLCVATSSFLFIGKPDSLHHRLHRGCQRCWVGRYSKFYSRITHYSLYMLYYIGPPELTHRDDHEQE